MIIVYNDAVFAGAEPVFVQALADSQTRRNRDIVECSGIELVDLVDELAAERAVAAKDDSDESRHLLGVRECGVVVRVQRDVLMRASVEIPHDLCDCRIVVVLLVDRLNFCLRQSLEYPAAHCSVYDWRKYLL